MKYLLYLIALLALTYATQDIEILHGYSGEPVARQRLCNLQNNILCPPYGQGIPDVKLH